MTTRAVSCCLLYMLLGMILGAAGCVEDSFSAGSPDGAVIADSGVQDDDFGVIPDLDPNRDAFQCRGVIDLVFVLDVSSSMGFVLDTLSKEIDLVVSASNQLASGSYFGLMAFVDNHHLDTTGPQAGGRVHTQSATLSTAFNHYKTVYTIPNRNPGDGPTGPTMQNPICEENSNDALYEAAQQFPWRDNANRVIILVTDDTFLERPDNYGDRDGDGLTDKTDFPREGDYPAQYTMDETVAMLQDKKVRVFAFTRLKEPGLFAPGRCGTGRRLPWSAVPNGWSKPYDGKQPIPDSTGGKNFDLDQVFAGKLSLTATINDMVLESHCKPLE